MGNVASAILISSKPRSKQKSLEKVKDGSMSKSKSKKTPFRDSTTNADISRSSSSEQILSKDSPVPTDCPEELKVIRDFIRHKDEHNLEKMRELTAEDCLFTFINAETEMPAREFYEAMKDIYASFPNLHFFWKSMKIKGVQGPESRHPGTVVVIEDYYGLGKHTGKPYFFGPYPPVDPAGMEVRDDDIEFTITVQDGKITNATIDAFGKMVGPPGFYSKIGGVII
jgi:ketosteroid isomerase-like protein